jgi:predicted RNA binding protein YcfA (HicA-like mRNA interferase family)
MTPPRLVVVTTRLLPVARYLVKEVAEQTLTELARQKGSHMILVKDDSWATLSVPDHKEAAPGTLRSLVRASGLTVEAFLALAKK